MKNKIVTCIILTAVILCVSVASVMAQAKSTFAGDIIIEPSQTLEYGEPRVTVAYNGDVYVARLARPNGENMWTGYDVLRSTDGGQTFVDLTTNLAVPLNTYFTALDILACGDNDTEFKLCISVARINLDNNEAKIGFGWFNNAGVISGGVLLESATYNSNSSRGWESISLSSDTKDPASQSAPFSVSIAAAKASLLDSVIVWTGNDGGATFTRRGLASTTGFIKNVSCATGTVASSTYGRLGVVWDEYTNSADEFGNVKAHFIWADDATDFSTSGPYNVGFSSGEYKDPVITMANNKNLTDYRGCITYVFNNGQERDVNTRPFDQLINTAPQITSIYSSVTVANTIGDEIDPHTSYNPADDQFLFTYYNAGNDALVYKTAPFDDITTPPVTGSINYRDEQTAMTNPMPHVDGLTSHRNFFVWIDQHKTLIDNEIKWPASVQSAQVSVSDMKLYPNPATDNITLTFSAGENDKASVSVIDMSGRVLQNAEAAIAKGNNKLPIALSNLPAGNYTLRISGAHTNTAVMFTIQH